MLHYQVQCLGENRGTPRLWLQGRVLEVAGFAPGMTYSVEIGERRLHLRVAAEGNRVVSGKRRADRTLAVIDVNSRRLLAALSVFRTLRIVVLRLGELLVTPTASEERRLERIAGALSRLLAGDTLAAGSVCHGGGILSHAAHQGLAEAGVDCSLAWANEIRPELIDHASGVNECWEPDTIGLAAPLQELAFDRQALARLPCVDVLEAGLACSGASASGRAKRHLAAPEAHPEVGHLVAGFLALVAWVNPLIIQVENVPLYQDTASAWILRNQLRDWGYVVHEIVLDGAEFNALEHRKRLCLVAVTEGVPFSFDAFERPHAQPQRLGDILEPIPLDDPCWSAMEGLKTKEVRDLAAGKGFRMQVFDEDSPKLGTLTKGYAKRRSTDPRLRHPSNPELLRQFTPTEHARAKHIPALLVAGASTTLAHEILGQSIVHSAFVAVWRLIGRSLLQWSIAEQSHPSRARAA